MFNLFKTKFDKSHESEFDGFKISFPGIPQSEEHPNLRIYKFGWNGEGYVVTVSDSKITDEEDIDESGNSQTRKSNLFEAQKAGLKRSVNVQKNLLEVMSVEESTFMGVPSVDLIYMNAGLYNYDRRFYIGDRLFSVIAGNRKRGVAKSNFEEFIKTFELLP